MSKAYLIFGSNMGDRLAFLKKAIFKVETNVGNIISQSSIYDTEPWGFVHENTFLNQVITVKTNLEPFVLLDEIKKIEDALGRIRENTRYTARTIDIDILFYDDLILHTSELMIPHPEIQRRKFVLGPLMEIAPDLMHPVLKKTIKQLFEVCDDKSVVYRY